jgi:hypothetical protein
VDSICHEFEQQHNQFNAGLSEDKKASKRILGVLQFQSPLHILSSAAQLEHKNKS